MFAQFANITGMDMSDLDRAASTLVALGNKMAATEGQILEFSLRLGAAGSQFGLTEAQIMALGATMASLGLEPEAGGTAMTQTLNAMASAAARGGPSLQAFANVAGKTADEFAEMVHTDPSGALMEFIEGFSQLDLADQLAVLDDLGLSGIRTSDALRRLAADPKLLADALNIASDAWSENTALMDEAAKRADTAQGMLNELGNAAKDLLIDAGTTLLPVIKDIVEGLTLITRGDFAGGLAKIGEAISGIAGAVGNLVKGLADTALTGLENLFHIELPDTKETLAIWQGIVDNIGVIISTLWTEHIQPAVQPILDFFNVTLPAAFSFFTNTTLPNFENAFTTLWTETIQPAIQPIADFFTITLPDAIADFVTTVEGIWASVQQAFAELRAGIEAALQPILDLITGIVGGLRTITGTVVHTPAEAEAALRAGGNQAIDTSNLDPVGSRQYGGLIPRTGLYNLHQGEDVLTPQEARAFRRGGMGGVAPAYVYAYGENPYALIDKIDRARRNRGR